MRDGIAKSRIQPFVRPVLNFVAVVVGVALPFDFFSQVDGYLMYLYPWELFPLLGWAWLTYAFIGLATGLGVTGLALGIATLTRRNAGMLLLHICAWLSMSIVALELLRGGKLWIGGHDLGHLSWWISLHKQETAICTILICAVWIWVRGPKHDSLQKIANLGAACGLLLTLSSPLVVMFKDTSAQQTQLSAAKPLKSGPDHPNIILVTVDALAANRIPIYGYSRQTAPSLTKFARGATSLDRFYANGNFTTPTVNSLINGVRPWTHRSNQLMARTQTEIGDQGLVARLKRAGYQTWAISTNPYAAPFHNGSDRWLDKHISGRVHETLPMLQAFFGQRFHYFIQMTNMSVIVATCDILDRLMVVIGIWPPVHPYDPELALSAAQAVISKSTGEGAFFIWVHLLVPHAPYAIPAPFINLFDRSRRHLSRFNSTPPSMFLAAQQHGFPEEFSGRYDEAISYTDYHLGQFCTWLKERDLFDGALVVISSDHGESFSHGYGGHGGPLLHDDLIHLPLLIKEPHQTTGRRLSTLSEQVDIMPTILDLAHVPIDGNIEGRSLQPAFNGHEMNGVIYSMNFEQNSRFRPLTTGTIAMIEAQWKYISYFGPISYAMMPKLEDALYDLGADPNETKNLVTEQPAIAARMRSAIAAKLLINSVIKQ